MKLKGVNPFEQYVEWIVLGFVALVLAAVIAMQALLQPNLVTIAGQSGLRPDQKFEPAGERAIALQGRLSNPNPALPEIDEQTLAEQFAARLEATSGSGRLAVALGTPAAIEAGDVGVTADGGRGYAMPALPAPVITAAHAYRNTVHPSEWVRTEELRPFLPAEQPFDLGYATVEAVFDGEAVREALLRDPDGDSGPLRPLPVTWWRSGFTVLAFEAERQRWTPGEGEDSGSWGETEVVASVPGGFDALSEVDAGMTLDDLLFVVQDAEQLRESVAQPPALRSIAGPRWQRPTIASAEAADDPFAEEIESKERELRQIEERIDRIVGQEDAERNEPRRSPARGPGGLGPRGPGGGPQSPRDRDPDNQENTRLARLESDRDELLDEIADLEDQRADFLAEQGLDEDEFEVVGALFDSPELRVWAHDIEAGDGGQYRYRLRAVFNNPAFGRELALDEEQRSLAADPLMYGPWSDWSEPVSTLGDQYYFLADASAGAALGGASRPSATFELYEFFYGYYRQADARRLPGDVLVAEATLPEGLIEYDLENLEEELPAQREPRGPAFDPREPIDPRAPGGGRRGTQGEPREFDPRGREPRRDLDDELEGLETFDTDLAISIPAMV
ncbi:MAG: hypothetical protein AAF747_05190, partial [Planctomycetota bacterium]